jgi:hypothetical protein
MSSGLCVSPFGPIARLDVDNQLVTAMPVRLEHGCFAFTDIGPAIPEGVDDIRLVRDDHNIAVGGRRNEPVRR